MKGMIKIIVLVVIALASFVGYTYVFATVLGVETDDAISVITTGTVPSAVASYEEEVSDSTEIENPEDSEEELMSKADSLDRQMIIIDAARVQLESLRVKVEGKMKVRNDESDKKLDDLAKIYNGMNPVQLAEIMGGMSNSMIVEILPRMKKPKVSKILESLPPERAAVLSALLLGRN